MASKQCIRVHRFGASSPDDVSELAAAVSQGVLNPAGIMAVLGKTEGKAFYETYAKLLAEAYPTRADGITLFPFRRLFIVARRA